MIRAMCLVAMLAFIGHAAAEERLFQINNCPEESLRYCKIYTYAEKHDGEWRAMRVGLVASECEFFRDTNTFSGGKKCYQGDELLVELRKREVMVAPYMIDPWQHNTMMYATGDTRIWSATVSSW